MVKVTVHFSGMVTFQYTKNQNFTWDLYHLDKVILFCKRDNAGCQNHFKKKKNKKYSTGRLYLYRLYLYNLK